MKNIDMKELVTPKENALDIQAEKLHEQFFNCSKAEQLRFLKNVLINKIALKTYESELNLIEGDSQ